MKEEEKDVICIHDWTLNLLGLGYVCESCGIKIMGLPECEICGETEIIKCDCFGDLE